MRKTFMAVMASLPIMVVGCGSGSGDLGEMDTGDYTEGEIMAVALTGGAASDATEEADLAEETQSDMNVKAMEVVSQRIEEELSLYLEDEDFRSALEEAQLEADASKDVSVQFGWKGLKVAIEDEEVPFAGGSMILNGDLGLKLRLRSRNEIALEADGELSSMLQGVERSGEVRGMPYYLSLDGVTQMDVDASFAVTIKRWKIRSMTANFDAAIVGSDVTATGSIADRSVTGSVDMVDVGISLFNDDILAHPKDFDIECSGVIETSVNGEVLAACEISQSCNGCK
ncbi:MAG: hypothetical protein HN337_00165 [Deltaproteobacteria bacterium]|jgi:hypothetical protein|nr:hypothetical protein [Deltaproteobacteria bacterium]